MPAQPIPEGHHTITPHLTVAGGADAIEFYKKAFNAEEVMRMPGPDGKTVMHSELKIGNSLFYLNDEFPQMGAMGPKSIGGTPVTVHMYVKDVDAAMKQAETAGAKVMMPATDMFWGDRYGKIEDPFGHQWSIATHTEDLTPEQIGERMSQQMGGCS